MSGTLRKFRRGKLKSRKMVVLKYCMAQIALLGEVGTEHITIVLDIESEKGPIDLFEFELDGSPEVQALNEIAFKIMEKA